ncbi:MAG: hypothetical protein V4662_27780 [Verrucomicrobiota bacterium]
MDNPPPSSASRPAGFATIALASAAGVIVASRMGRPALALAAGLALAWWRKRQQTHQPVPAQAPVHREPAPVLMPAPVTQELPPTAPELPPTLVTPPPAEPVAMESPPAPVWLPEPEPESEPAPAVVAETAPFGSFPPSAPQRLRDLLGRETTPFEASPPPPTQPVVNEAFFAPPPEPEPAPEFAPPPFSTPFAPPPPDPVEATYEPPTIPSLESLAASFVPTSPFADPETSAEDFDPEAPLAFPIAPLRAEAPLADAWNDLRAALNPSLAGKNPKSEPLPPFPSSDEPPANVPTTSLPRIEAPEMPEMYVFPPSSPLLDTLDEDEPLPTFPDTYAEASTVPLTYAQMTAMPDLNVFPATSPLIESPGEDTPAPQPHHPPAPAYDSLHYIPQPSTEPVGEIPDEIHLPGMTDEETAAALEESGFLVTDPEVAAEPATPQFIHAFTPPAILSPTRPATETEAPASEASPPQTPPVTISHEAQTKKSFFDWLRS